MKDIVETALHETGHFFGLRHTTATKADIEILRGDYDIGDYSNLDDGLDDTPYCGAGYTKSLMKIKNTDIVKVPGLSRIYIASNTSTFNVNNCPDADNYMFPTTVKDKVLTFSKQQLDMIRKNLMIFPH